MAQPKHWVDEIREALEELGGEAHLSEIYHKVLERDNMNFDENKNVEEKIRQTIQRYSGDSETFNGKEDIFYSVRGIGEGYWGIR
jgi:putative restriction endonuclease